jgi:hypothetical protein
VIAYRATLDVPRELTHFVAVLLLAERRRRGTPRGSGALTCLWEAVLGLRWYRDRFTRMRWPVVTASRGPPSTATWTRYHADVIATCEEPGTALSEPRQVAAADRR